MDFENNIHQNMSSCMLCGRNCGANRNDGLQRGFCNMNNIVRVARASLHMWEEPPISGTNGSGTLFFSGDGDYKTNRMNTFFQPAENLFSG